MAHLSKGVSARFGEAWGPKSEKKTIVEIDEIPNLLHPLIYFIRGLLLTIGGYKLKRSACSLGVVAALGGVRDHGGRDDPLRHILKLCRPAALEASREAHVAVRGVSY